MLTKKESFAFLFFFAGLLIFSCKKDESTFQNIQLEVEKIDGLFHFNWSPVNVSTFENYYVAFSDEPIDSTLSPFNFQGETISDRNITSTNFAVGLNSSQIYFRLFVNLGERWLTSDQISITNDDVFVIDILPSYLFALTVNYTLQKFSFPALEFIDVIAQNNLEIRGLIMGNSPRLIGYESQTQKTVILTINL